MNTYHHVKHAGNLADLHKHLLLSHLLETLKIDRYLETHAGSGLYELPPEGEWQQGINLLWKQSRFKLAEVYFQALQTLNPEQLQHYPGSPWLAERLLGAGTLTLFELEMEAADQLRHNLAGVDVRTGDGFSGVLPLIEPHSLILIDPPYKDDDDYERVITLLESLEPIPDIHVMLWYPVFSDGSEKAFLSQLDKYLGNHCWRSELNFAEPVGQLSGSGVAVFGDEPLTTDEQCELCELADWVGSTVRFV
ncbi:23S rRNA (adenine(2030)-N(6))-methyltransferase RlmJ [Marinobacterium jannaschii]|uniref:23S rRNA (adenine(2030)-N(6))-methyltransferase RlmJ n=1 Tax=Marinobacterium jannaschii TaxID=64970 RepID=UPI000684A94F|nr:23S rRNA (adenine(2030)-N(6))-methyltransferase RlmJ [Marinobacterium jannaschii]